MHDKNILIKSRVKLIDSSICEKFKINPRCIGTVTRIFNDRATVEFIQNEQRTTIDVFIKSLKRVK